MAGKYAYVQESKYKPEYCKMLIDLLTAGKTKAHFYHAAGGIYNRTCHEWADRIPEFAEAMRKAELAYELYWQDVLENTDDPNRINVAKYKLKNCNYSTRVSSHKKGGGYKDMKDLSKEIEREFDDPDTLDRKVETHAKKLGFEIQKKAEEQLNSED